MKPLAVRNVRASQGSRLTATGGHRKQAPAERIPHAKDDRVIGSPRCSSWTAVRSTYRNGRTTCDRDLLHSDGTFKVADPSPVRRKERPSRIRKPLDRCGVDLIHRPEHQCRATTAG